MNMTDRMKNIDKYMKKTNSDRIGWIMIWLTALLIMPLSSFQSGSDTGLFYLICSAGLLFAATWEYMNKFLEIARVETGSGEAAFGLIQSAHTGRFSDIMCLHAFDSKGYFRHLLLHLIPMQALTIVYAAALGIGSLLEREVSVCLVLAAAGIPVMTVLIRGAVFRYTLMHENRILSAMGGVIGFAYDLLRFVVYEIILISIVLLAFALLGSHLTMYGIGEEEVAMISVSARPQEVARLSQS